ncbi:hypothetical protein CH379_001680 [Leptospira ellisii]|uniref:Uncharacterized protein n=1 Tax=Leptospira ellisii TaxID=2023197 RepID=A0A2N0BE66_9LEPT|nr:hypothetical protein [Leptospira ellisii]MDV6234340.1 hypothetical protein [Leptospira ellisii]PJZ94859.1 hypothetical protein CH379_00315 [Leptospira ellisii]PKA05138.1 hypothetical protein CH375_06895 [Leptospira ellisii]
MKQNEIDFQHPSVRDQIRFYSLVVLAGILMVVAYKLGSPSYYLGWFAFLISAFSVAGNDAVQTVGTFIESKKTVHWIPKVAVLGGAIVLVFLFAWLTGDSQVHFGRLESFPEVREFNLIQLLAPLILVVITRLKSPISTTFLILGLFGGSNIEKMLTKSFFGYGIAFGVAILVWGILVKLDPKEYTEDHVPDPRSEKRWAFFQWISTIYLWIAWLRQDAANIVVYLPRQLSALEFVLAVGMLVLALGIILYTNGGTIQEIVTEKSDIQWSKAATIVDLVYGTILIVFHQWSKMPMSTTWVFLGMLAGREIILNFMTYRDLPYLETFRKVGKDVLLASIGIAVSIFVFILASQIYPENVSEFMR